MESAEIGGAAHLINFAGTDNLPAIDFLRKYYAAPPCGGSVMASEHATTTIYGKDMEASAYEHFIRNAAPTMPVSIVVDSYDTLNAVGTILGVQLKELIMSRPGKVVVRPDSGTPEVISVEVLDLLWHRFGGTLNEKGFKVLDPHVGMIYGDGINYDSIGRILENVVRNGFCVSNIVFGMGGGLLQQVDRDTQKFALKASSAVIDGKTVNFCKEPKTDTGKASKAGRVYLVRNNFGSVTTLREDFPVPPGCGTKNLLVPIMENGKFLRKWTYSQVIANKDMDYAMSHCSSK